MVTTNWFATEQQVLALTIITIFSVLGPIAGAFYSLIFINTNVMDIDTAKDMMFKATLYIAVTYSCIYFVSILIFQDKPEVPPWYSYKKLMNIVQLRK
jgi:hypothetical protein